MRAAGPLVLVVDDEPAIRRALELLLTDEGYRVQTACHGQEALACVAREQPAVILLDLNMPVMDGHRFAARLHAQGGAAIPLVLMTAAGETALATVAVPVVAAVGKPFDLVHVLAVVAGVCGSATAG